MYQLVDGGGDEVVCGDPVRMTTSEDTVCDTGKGVRWSVLQPFKEEVGIVGRLETISEPIPNGFNHAYLTLVGCGDYGDRPIGR